MPEDPEEPEEPRPPWPSKLRGGRPFPITIDALRAIDVRARPNLKRAIPALLTALASFGFGDHLGGIPRTRDTTFAMFGRTSHLSKGQVSILVLGLSVVFVAAGIIATRSVAGELGRVSEAHGGVAAASAVRLICMIVGYGIVLLAVLGLLRVDLANLLVGGAVTGVIVGIAAQQTLGNFFAGLVLLFARPYVPGQRVKVRSGAMGGPFDGVILGAGLMYTVIDTDEGLISMPNSGLLAAAIGPSDELGAESEEDAGTAPPVDPATGPGGNPA
jgi:small-conductance mechanosensitive channel